MIAEWGIYNPGGDGNYVGAMMLMRIARLWPVGLVAAAVLLGAPPVFAQLVPDPLGKTFELPAEHPESWIVVHDAAFMHPNDGKFIVLDAALDEQHARYKGMFNGSFVAQIVIAESAPEIYIVETYHSRGNRGVRTDVLTFYDKTSLAPTGEVVLPSKRALTLPIKHSIQLVDNEKLAVVFNLTPATSVSVVDVKARKFRGEIPIPGCSMVYPTGERGFSSLCANGTMLTVQLDEQGQMASSGRSEKFFDIDADALFEKPAVHEGVYRFPTFQGNVVAIDLSGDLPSIAAPWSLTAGVEGGWRPGGLQPAAADSSGRMYVLMHPGGMEGSHKDPGVEVWAFDPESQARLARIPLRMPALVVEVTRGERPLLVATNVNMNLDVYDAVSGEFLRTLADFGQETPLALHAAR